MSGYDIPWKMTGDTCQVHLHSIEEVLGRRRQALRQELYEGGFVCELQGLHVIEAPQEAQWLGQAHKKAEVRRKTI
jgi:hypothetical protein